MLIVFEDSNMDYSELHMKPFYCYSFKAKKHLKKEKKTIFPKIFSRRFKILETNQTTYF